MEIIIELIINISVFIFGIYVGKKTLKITLNKLTVRQMLALKKENFISL